MVVLAASILTKTGQPVLSRQFVEITRSRVEALLASFPKLLNASAPGSASSLSAAQQQHTFVETDAVRYLYQPLDDLYLLLLTNKQSNILEDIQLLSLFSRLVGEYTRSLKLADVEEAAFELLIAFDELIAPGGQSDVINLQLVHQHTEMDSHAERMQEMLQKSKEREAMEQAKLKAKQLDMQRREQKRKGSSVPGSGFGNTGGSSPFMPGAPAPYSSRPQLPMPTQSGPLSPPPIQQATAAGAPSKGLKLGGGGSGVGGMGGIGGASGRAAGGMFDAIRQEEGLGSLSSLQTSAGPAPPTAASPLSPKPGATSQPLASPQQLQHSQDVHIVIDEKISAKLNRDGGVDALDVKGELVLRVAKPEEALCRVEIAQGIQGVQFKSHPNVDKAAWSSQSVLASREGKPFALNAPLPVLKWRYQSTDESLLPLLVSVWPSPSSTGTHVTVEYELLSDEVRQVAITIPVAAHVQCDVSDGNAQFHAATKRVEWRLDVIDSSNSSGTLEFTLPSDFGGDAGAFFPVDVSFSAAKGICGVSVKSVTIGGEAKKPVPYQCHVTMATESYQVV